MIATATPPAGGSRPLDQLDLLTVVRGFQAISGELRLDRLAGVLLELVLQHSQADRGCLLLADGPGSWPGTQTDRPGPCPAAETDRPRLRLAAEAEVARDLIRVSTRIDRAPHDRVPVGLVEHAGRLRRVLAGGPDEIPAFATDPYLAAHRPRSVVCAPIVRRDNLLAVLYLENRRVAAAFSPSYLELLDVLRTQAAIALENATVHAQLVAANQILDATFDQLPAGLILLGADLSVRRASPRAVEIMGVPIAPGSTLVELIDGFPAGPATLPGPIHRVAVIRTPAGERRLSTSSIPLRDRTGTLVGVTVQISPAD
jgi:GAF domain-containing protein